MSFNYSINVSKNALVINLDQVKMEEIVEEKLRYVLNKRPLGKSILKDFYEPSERAFIEFCLEKMKGNQFKTAKLLGINRNTLKKKILAYKLDIKKLVTRDKEYQYPKSRIFLSSADSLDLLLACRAKLSKIQAKDKKLKENTLKEFCRPVEKRIIELVLKYCKGNQIRASHFLGINRNTLKSKIRSSHEASVHQ